MSQPNAQTSIDTLTKVVNPVWNMDQKDTTVLDTSVNDRYFIKVYNQGRITQDQKQFRFLIQNKTDFLQYAESFFRIQFRVNSANPHGDTITFADDVRSFFYRISVKLSNTEIENRWDIPTIAATERLFWSDAVKKNVGTGLLAYDDHFRTPGSAFTTEEINPRLAVAAQGQGQIAVVTDTAPSTIVPADTFNSVIPGNGIKWFMSRSEKQVEGEANGTAVEGFFRLSDVCDFFKNYRSVTRGVICEVRLDKSDDYRCVQMPSNFDPLLHPEAKIEWDLPVMTDPPNSITDGQADGVTWFVPVYRPSPVMLNIMEERLARSIQTDVMYERADVYTSDNMKGSQGNWRIVTTPFKITKAIVFFRIYSTETSQFKTWSPLHSQSSNARMTNISMNLNGNQIPLVADLQSYFSTAIGQGEGNTTAGIGPPVDPNTRYKKAAYPYQQHLQMAKALQSAYPSSNYTGSCGLSYEDFLYNYPHWCFQVSENYGEAEANDRQTSSLILNWKSLSHFPETATAGPTPIQLQAVCVLFTLHQVNIITGSAQESVVRSL